jgi:hypothetical protein
MITQNRIKELLNYNPETGVFIWIKPRRGVVVGSECGRLSVFGYREFCIDYKLMRAHRVAFLYMTGKLPDCDVDHINRVRNDNRWANLRLCNATQNAANASLKLSNTSGIKGVSWDAVRNKWLAQIRINGKKKNLGRFNSVDDAAECYKNAALIEFGEFVNECVTDRHSRVV